MEAIKCVIQGRQNYCETLSVLGIGPLRADRTVSMLLVIDYTSLWKSIGRHSVILPKVILVSGVSTKVVESTNTCPKSLIIVELVLYVVTVGAK